MENIEHVVTSSSGNIDIFGQMSDPDIIRVLNFLPSADLCQSIKLVSKHFLCISNFTHHRPILRRKLKNDETLSTSEVAARLKKEFDSDDINDASELCEQFPSLSNTSKSPTWYYFVVRVGEEIFNERLSDHVPMGFEKRTAKGMCDSIFHRTWNIISELRHRRSNNASHAKLAKKGNVMCLLHVREVPNPINSPFITQPTPMPVDIAPIEELQPFFDLLVKGNGITEEFAKAQKEFMESQRGFNQEKKYRGKENEPLMIMKRGALFVDGRMDMCKQVVGDEHIEALCDAVGNAKCFVDVENSDNQDFDTSTPNSEQAISMTRGTLFADGRMDMCKQVVGDTHIEALCTAVGNAKCFTEENENTEDTCTDANQSISMIRGTLFADGRMDMCKQVVGHAHIQPLCESVGRAKCFNSFEDTVESSQMKAVKAPIIRHFLLGNNVACQNKPEAAIHIANLIRLNRPIETFYLAGNCLTGLSIRMISEALENNSHVNALWLKRNPVGPEGAKSLGSYLASANCTLRILDLQNCGLGDEGLERFCRAIEDRLEKEGRSEEELTLRHLYIDANAITGTSLAFARFCKLLSGPLRGLKTLYLSINVLGDSGTEKLSKVLPSLYQLRFLSLASNQITDAVMPSLLDALSQLPNLKGIDLGCYKSTRDLGGVRNSITESSLPIMEEWIYDHPQLEYFDIRNNDFTGQDALLDFVERIRKVVAKRHQRITLQATQSYWKSVVNKDLMILRHKDKQTLRFVKHTKKVVNIDSIYRNKM
ncbi:protein phosphatase 1 regulatory subunit 37 [Ditylenchus destructor]|nr:protein phosphatase 1 regulatory subunit 37 [Ditylenchus destructor]